MRSRIVALVATLALLLAVAAPANADINGKVRKLQTKVSLLQSQVGVLNDTVSCLRAVPVTSYYGYWYSDFYTTALDFTESGSSPDAYLVRDACGAIAVGRPVGDSRTRK